MTRGFVIQGFMIRGFVIEALRSGIRAFRLPERLLHCDRVSHRRQRADFFRDCGH
jgi:hypothetical protein